MHVPHTIWVFGGKNSKEKKLASWGSAAILSVIFSMIYTDAWTVPAPEEIPLLPALIVPSGLVDSILEGDHGSTEYLTIIIRSFSVAHETYKAHFSGRTLRSLAGFTQNVIDTSDITE